MITEGQILLDGEDLTEAGADERAQQGLSLHSSTPVNTAIFGVTVATFLRAAAINANRKPRTAASRIRFR